MPRPELAQLDDRYDLIVIGGGITGAGVLRKAVRGGAKVLLVEKDDYASGTSSRSSKLVHGGLRYLRSGQWRLTLESVRERERLLREAPDLVEPLPFLLPLYRRRKPSRWLTQLGLFVYDVMAGKRDSRFVSANDTLARQPGIACTDLIGAMSYTDATTDDARLVLRMIFDAVALGATALNYVHADIAQGRVQLTDRPSGAVREIGAAMIVNATGAWSGAATGAPKLRPLRGSHFVFPIGKFPLRQAVSWQHPRDQRPLFALPWQGAVVYGTTDLDHTGALEAPRMQATESTYLLEALAQQFPDLKLKASDAIASYAGVRPVVASGADSPSAESRESAIWSTPGMVGVAGGKLTTFRVTARDVLREAAKQVPKLAPAANSPLFSTPSTAQPGTPIAGTPFTWEDLRRAARDEHVVHLADLLLRRTRLGLVVEHGGAALLPEIRQQCAPALGWDDARWTREAQEYLAYWQQQHAPEGA